MNMPDQTLQVNSFISSYPSQSFFLHIYFVKIQPGSCCTYNFVTWFLLPLQVILNITSQCSTSFVSIPFNLHDNPMKRYYQHPHFSDKKKFSTLPQVMHHQQQSKADLEPKQPDPNPLNLTTHTSPAFQCHPIRIFSSHYYPNTKI